MPNGRPTLSGKKKSQFENYLYNKYVSPDGLLRDYNTQQTINWKPGQPRKDIVDFGHRKGRSYNEMFQKYKNGQITLDELKEFKFNPDNYILQTPFSNRSHIFE